MRAHVTRPIACSRLRWRQALTIMADAEGWSSDRRRRSHSVPLLRLPARVAHDLGRGRRGGTRTGRRGRSGAGRGHRRDTRIEISADPSAVWPWLVQMGPGRGGAYTYDWIERRLGIDIRNTNRILPEIQNLQVGDEIPMPGYGMRVERFDPERALVLRSSDGRWVWSFELRRTDGRTRLISRNRFNTSGYSPKDWLGYAVMEPGSWVMERKMLRTLKERAEHLARKQRGEAELDARAGRRDLGRRVGRELLVVRVEHLRKLPRLRVVGGWVPPRRARIEQLAVDVRDTPGNLEGEELVRAVLDGFELPGQRSVQE